ncbi:MAG: adenylate/guanylate cyclase domain-containing protein [Candidatus Omnitrophota bacterium]|nr:adenylate/guanylate cyclase domain-containing protein [Candidatus Omnitrophota bacterium]
MSQSVLEEKAWVKLPWPLACLLTGAAMLWVAVLGNPLQLSENQWFDQCLRWRHQAGLAPSVDARLLHLDITGKDLAGLASLEDEYEAAARLIREASALGAELVVFDVIYGRGTPAMGERILRSIRESAVTVVLAEGYGADAKKVSSFPYLESLYAPAGLINVSADADGVYRHYRYVQREGGDAEPSLALAAYMALEGLRWREDVRLPRPGVLEWQVLSPDGTQRVARQLKVAGPQPLLDFRSGWTATGPAAIPHLRLEDLFALSVNRATPDSRPLAGKVLFVSYAASGVVDFGATAFGENTPLVSLHAVALNDLLQESLHSLLPRWAAMLTLLLTLAMPLAAQGIVSDKLLTLFWFLGGVTAAGLSMGFLLRTQWVLPFVLWTVLWTVLFLAEMSRRYGLVLIRRLRLQITMGYYFSPRVMEKVLANPGAMDPQHVRLTVLLTDLRNFTPLSEKLGTRGIFALLNQVFEVQTQAVMAEDASLEHFLGDQFLCYWGAPDPQPDAAERAVRGAVALMRAMEEIKGTLSEEIRQLFGYGVALHTGQAMIGNIGSALRLDYGVVGDLINSTARVESLTKVYKLPFIMTRETYAALHERPPYRAIDTVRVVGKSTPLELIEVRHPFGAASFDALAADYAIIYERYHCGDFESAARGFLGLAERFGDGASRLLAARCREFLTEPPRDWDGIYRFQAK